MQLKANTHQEGASLLKKMRNCTTTLGAPTSLLAMLIIVCLSSQSIIPQSFAFPSGAPDQACKDLKPGHGVEPTSGVAPFQLSAERDAVAASGDQIKVTLSSSSGTTFKGLIVQALNGKGEPVGKFLAGKGLKLVDTCSAVTHSDREAKKTATLVWEAPADIKPTDKITFKATVVHKFDQFYTDIKSTVA